MAGDDFSDYGFSFLKIDADEEDYSSIPFDSIEQERYSENSYSDRISKKFSLDGKGRERRSFGSISGNRVLRTPETTENDMDMKIRQMTEFKRRNLAAQSTDLRSEETENKKLKKQLSILLQKYENVIEEKEKKEHELLCEIELLKRELVREDDERLKIKEKLRENFVFEKENKKLKAYLHKIESDHSRERDLVFKTHNQEISKLHYEQKRRIEELRKTEKGRTNELVRERLNELALKVKFYYEKKYKEAVCRIKKTYDEKYEESVSRIRRRNSTNRRNDCFDGSDWGWSTYH